MSKSEIDRDKLRTIVRKLPVEYLLQLLDRAIDLLPKTRLSQLIDGYIDQQELRPDCESAGSLVESVKAFHGASLRGEYYEDFQVNSKNYMQKSRGTQIWIAECNRLLELCVARTRKGVHSEAVESFEMIFGLLRHIDEGNEDVIFFADEGGSWEVGVDWRQILPAWFRSLAQTAEPADYAQAVVSTIDEFVEYDREYFLKEAQSSASPKQKKALQS